uniref:Peptidase S1 domain-containing protein n=1 Tax=Anopheles dirus TaxID=7168 RepID=A0A182N6R8_9DIPT
MNRTQSHALTLAGVLCLLLTPPCMAQTCGKRKVVNLLILSGTDAKEGDWPWHAILFHKIDFSLAYKCGGTILDVSTILTAAHCLVTSGGKIARERLLVQVGRNQLLISNNRAQEYDVLEVIVHPGYNHNGVRNDIALIKLANEITYNDLIQPICLWNRGEELNSIVNTRGTVVGFGYSDRYKNSLQEVRIPVVSTIECIQDNPTYGTLLTAGMFCAGNQDGIGPCNGDSGGGMFFNYSDVWYIRGLVSFTKPQSGTSNMCDPKEYTIFTDVAKYLDWMKQYLRPTSIQPSTSTKGDVKKLAQPTCGRKHCPRKDDGCWPWYAAVLNSNYDQDGFGTILNEKTILTVQIGGKQRHQLHFELETSASEIIVHPNYNYGYGGHDIALIFLYSKITFTDRIQPICLWNRGNDQSAIFNTFATMVTIGEKSETHNINLLHQDLVPVVSTDVCIESNRDVYSRIFTSDMFCAGNLGDALPCLGDGGGGLYFNYDDVWYIRGMISFRAKAQNYGCDPFSYTVFTDVAQHLDWIEQEMLCLLSIASCLAQTCGKRKAVNLLILGGTDAKEGDWPWHAMVFHKTDRSFSYECGGTILDESTVLTAAHCLATSAGVMNRERIFVKVGQHRLMIANNRAQEYDALKLILHPKFHGVRNDIALIKLANEITYTDFIQPICLWNRGEDQHSIVNTTGTVVGFGYSGGYKTSLQEVRIPVVSTIECIEDNQAYGTLLVAGMFCAGKRDGVGPCNGDSGGGMFFNESDVWYIRGLVSFTKTQSSIKCDPNEYTVFTDVAKYKDWIEQHLPRSSGPATTVAKKRVPKIEQPASSNPIQTCGRRKAVDVHGDTAKEGLWPWYAMVYEKIDQRNVYQCGGAILDQNVILTAASCVSGILTFKAPENTLVRVGQTNFFDADNRMQEHNALELIVHPDFHKGNIHHDIALIKLATDITYTDYIQPVCLWKQEENQHSITNKLGTVIGFGFDETESILETLEGARIPVASASKCVESNAQLTSRMFCAGWRNGTGACYDRGSGIFFKVSEIWYIRGIVLFAEPGNPTCDPDDYTVFTDVAKYSNWMKQYLQPTSAPPHTNDNDKKLALPSRSICGIKQCAQKDIYCWPWHAAVHPIKKELFRFVYKCGGTILNEKTILTTANCVSTSLGVLQPKDVAVMIDRKQSKRPYMWTQKHVVSYIVAHPEYDEDTMQSDIALITLDGEITYTDRVQPICLWNRGNDQSAIVDTLATMVRADINFERNTLNALSELRVPVVSTDDCIANNRGMYDVSLTSKMLCAGNRGEGHPCTEDAGAGLYFKYDDVWYIRGIMSFRDRRGDGECDPNSYTVFTDLAYFVNWIERQMPMGRGQCCAVTFAGALCLLLAAASCLAQTCGKRKAVTFLITHGAKAKEGFWPWHVALFHNSGRQFSYACGGSILDQNMVLTAAHCLVTSKGKIARERLLVQVGRIRLGLAGNRAQEHEAFELIVHPKYSTNSIQHDIALIRLATDITYTDYIQPICLWKREEDLHSIENTLGTVIGFGYDETDQTTDTLREARIPVISAIECVEKNQGGFAQQLTSRMFCAGWRNGTGACNGDSGGGLFFNEGETWYIRGIVSFTKPREDDTVCDPKEYTVFTDVAKYLDWIGQYLRGTSGRPGIVANEDDANLALLPMDTCGANPYAGSDESSKPVQFGYPWTGLLEYSEMGTREKKTICQATLISDLYLVTGAQCISSVPKRYTLTSVRLGEYDKSTATDCGLINGRSVCSPPVQVLRIESVKAHPGFNTPRYANDIALVRLRDRADTSQINVKPICLPVTNELRSDKQKTYILTAWPTGSSGTTLERSLRDTVDSVACQTMYNTQAASLEKTSRQICIKQQQSDGSRCKFPTSAAPIQLVQSVGGRARYVLHGLLSYGPQKCTLYPDVYTNVISYGIPRRPILTMRGFLALAAICCLFPVPATIAQGPPMECGERKVKTVYLVQHGSETKEGHWPWHTAIYHLEGKTFNYVCGGSIVDRNTILTAAHCLYTSRGLIKVDQLSVQVGRNQLSEASAQSQEHLVEQLILHPGFSPNAVADDVALIRLATDITMTRYIQPICLWTMEPNLELIVGKNGTVVGFGLTEHERVSDYLRQATIGVVDSWTCMDSDRQVYGVSLTSGMYCGGGVGGVSVCNGDSGGGMFFEYGDSWYVRGIVSFMPLQDDGGLCDGSKYTVFTDVAKYREWIAQFINPTLASVRTDPLLVDNSPKLRLLNFNACGISPYSAGAGANDSFLAYPWMGVVEVALPGQNRTMTLCQVSLISEWYALGPAHCFDNDGRERTIRLGDYDLSTETDCTERNGTTICAPPYQILSIENIRVHPLYKRLTLTDDIALIEFRRPANISQPNVRPICLPVSVDLRSYKPERFTLSGLKAEGTRMVSSSPTYLNSVNCQERYNTVGHPLRKSYAQICANSLPANHTGPCDRMISGSVLQTVQPFGRRDRHFLQGLLSFGVTGCNPLVPDIYTNVAFYLDWILYNMRDIKMSEPDRSDQLIFSA